MAATAPSGISNARVDGITFTQDLCEAFRKLAAEREFTSFDLMNEINAGPRVDQFGRVFVLQEGWDLPITFRPQTSLSKNQSGTLLLLAMPVALENFLRIPRIVL